MRDDHRERALLESDAPELTHKDPASKVANELLYRHDESRLEAAEQWLSRSLDGDGHLFRPAPKHAASATPTCSIRFRLCTPRS